MEPIRLLHSFLAVPKNRILHRISNEVRPFSFGRRSNPVDRLQGCIFELYEDLLHIFSVYLISISLSHLNPFSRGLRYIKQRKGEWRISRNNSLPCDGVSPGLIANTPLPTLRRHRGRPRGRPGNARVPPLTSRTS